MATTAVRAAMASATASATAADPARRRWTAGLVAVAAGGAGLVGSGPVAGFVLTAYVGTAATLWFGRRAGRQQTQARVAAIDAVSGLAADLRAGAALDEALRPALGVLTGRSTGPPTGAGGAAEVGRRLAAALEVAEVSGAPVADVLDRLDQHLRAVDRARASAQAQAAGARASAGLLAVLPLGGVALGLGVGLDPARTLLHTPIGAVCTVVATTLQLAGLAWTIRLSQLVVPA